MQLESNAECDRDGGEVYMSKPSGKVSGLIACQKACRAEAGCQSITYYKDAWCSLFSTACARRIQGNNANKSMRWGGTTTDTATDNTTTTTTTTTTTDTTTTTHTNTHTNTHTHTHTPPCPTSHSYSKTLTLTCALLPMMVVVVIMMMVMVMVVVVVVVMVGKVVWWWDGDGAWVGGCSG